MYRGLLSRPGPAFPAMLVAREALEKIGYLDERIIAYQEWDTAIRLAKYYEFGFIAAPTFVYDCRGKDTISNSKPKSAMAYEQVVRKHFAPILRFAGPRALAQHYEILTASYNEAGESRAALRCFLVSAVSWPFSPIRVVGQFRRFLTN